MAIHAWSYTPSQEPMVGKAISSRKEPTTVILLDGDSTKPSSQYQPLCNCRLVQLSALTRCLLLIVVNKETGQSAEKE